MIIFKLIILYLSIIIFIDYYIYRLLYLSIIIFIYYYMKDIIELISNKIERPKEYHNFADKKNILNIPNTVNVVSNISFLIPVFYL